MKPHAFVQVLLLWMAIGFAPSASAKQPATHDPLTATNCVEQLRGATSEWIECDGAFEPDAAGRADLSRMTFDFVTDAKCGGKLRVRRKELVDARTDGRVLELAPQDVLCVFATNTDPLPPVKVTLAPKVSFRGGKVIDVSPQILKISDLPDLLVMPLRAAVETEVVRSQLAKGVNALLERAFTK
jgi:hypothetical protein